MDKIKDLTVDVYLKKMAVCDFPSPAAGSAAATAAAMAAALLEMSCDGSLRKHGENALLKESLGVGERLRAACLDLADEDIIAYGRVIAAAKDKKADPQAYQEAMKGATEPFLDILSHCHTLLVQIEKIIGSSFSRVLGDLVGGVYLAEAAAAASKSGVEVNLALVTDPAFKEKHLPAARALYQTCLDLKGNILGQVFPQTTGENLSQEDSQKVLAFWFKPENKPFWFQNNEAFDEEIRSAFYDHWLDGCNGLLSDWRETMDGRLAEIILLDQFSRNLNRDDQKAFAQDPVALVLAQEAVRQPEFASLSQEQQRFVLMPFMHSESALVHQKALPIFEQLGDPLTLEFEIMHKQIIDQFGRYPHRNALLNRVSTPAEIEFLKQPNSSF